MKAMPSASRQSIHQGDDTDTEWKTVVLRQPFFQPNVYEEDDPAAEWEIDDKERPYLKHVKSLSVGWRHLRLLADFMQVSTAPLRWKEFSSNGKWSERGPCSREEGAIRTNVTRIDYLSSGTIVRSDYASPTELREGLQEQKMTRNTGQSKFKLFVVEDLSRDVVEVLGAHYDIEPSFFREHILDYAWHSIRDRWMNSRRLNIIAKRQQWRQIRFPRARYFDNQESFLEAVEEAEVFNVLRKLEDDKTRGLWDHKDEMVGLINTRAAFWLGSSDSHPEETVGIYLVDPTVRAGFPLWLGYGNWKKTPRMRDLEYVTGKMPPSGPPGESFFECLIYWLQNPLVSESSSTNSSANSHVPMQDFLCLVCGKWLLIVEYIENRLALIEWEVSYTARIFKKKKGFQNALEKLLIWRRVLPQYKRMLTETLQQWFDEPNHTKKDDSNNNNDSGGLTDPFRSPLHNAMHVNELRDDFLRILANMEDYQQRVEGLTSVITAIISISSDEQARKENQSITRRLAALAIVFVPLSFISGLFSMQTDISQLRGSIKWYFITSVSFFGACAINLGLVYSIRWGIAQRA